MKCRCFISFTNPKIDREKGIIPGVAVVTIGEAQGHDMFVDQRTLQTVLEAVQKYKSGLKIKWNPDTNLHGSGSIIGLAPKETFRIEGNTLRADLHMAEKYPNKEYFYELAETQGDTFGLSMDFDCSEEEIEGKAYARCEEIYAATVVDQPAANPSGLWSIEPNKQPTKETMALSAEDKKELAALIGEQVKPINEAVAGLRTEFATVKKTVKELSESTAPIELSDVTDEEKLAADVEEDDDEETQMRKLRQYRATKDKPVTLGSIKTLVSSSVKAAMTGFAKEVGQHGAAKSSAKANKENGDNHEFVKKVQLQMQAGAKKVGLAIKQAAENNRDLYNDYIGKVSRGECKSVEEVCANN